MERSNAAQAIACPGTHLGCGYCTMKCVLHNQTRPNGGHSGCQIIVHLVAARLNGVDLDIAVAPARRLKRQDLPEADKG